MHSIGTSSPTRPRRLLSIDGGGLAGLIPAEALILIEKQLDELTGQSRPLCERFDLIGGTSTGAILAAGPPGIVPLIARFLSHSGREFSARFSSPCAFAAIRADR
jgi:hypothetical protein